MPKLKDLTGQKFGRLTVIERAENKGKQTRWRCKCECGAETIVAGSDLKSGHTRSCSCLNKEIIANDLTGQKFGRLTVIERAGSNKNGFATWRCKCECGNECIAVGRGLVENKTRSCGICLGTHHKHGMRHTRIYHIWLSMKDRCNNPNCNYYKNYGGRGIKICERWLEFQNFYEDVSKLEHFGEEGYSLDRIDNDGDYTPENVRLASRKTQCRNKRNNHLVKYEGEIMTLAEATERSGINRGTLWNRYKRGDRDDRLFRPVKK